MLVVLLIVDDLAHYVGTPGVFIRRDQTMYFEYPLSNDQILSGSAFL